MIWYISTNLKELVQKILVIKNLIDLFKKLKYDNINPRDVVKNKIMYKLDLGETKKATRNLKSKDHISAIQNVGNFFDLREYNIEFFRDYYFLLSKAKYMAKYGRGLKILSPKQMLQRLPTTLAQIKAVNTSENLLNEIRQIINSMQWAKDIAENIYRSIMNLIKL